MKLQHATILIILIAFFIISISACKQKSVNKEKYDNIEMSELEGRMTDETILLDVRTPQEFGDGTIAGSINIDVKSNDFATMIQNMDKDADYLIYCRSGRRSVKASEIMHEVGFKNLTNIKGGYLAYKEMKSIE